MKRWTIALSTVFLALILLQLGGQVDPIGPLQPLHISTTEGCEALANLVSGNSFIAATATGFSLGPAIFNFREAQLGTGLFTGKVVFGPILAPQYGVRCLYLKVGADVSADNDIVFVNSYSNPQELPVGILVEDAASLGILEKALRNVADKFDPVFNVGYRLEQILVGPTAPSTSGFTYTTHRASFVFRSAIDVFTVNFFARQLQPGGSDFGPLYSH